jgi:hypothetical protein
MKLKYLEISLFSRRQPRHLGDERAVRPDRIREVVVLRRIDAVVAAGEHGDRARGETAAVGGGVDAACQAGDHGEAGVAEVAREPLGEAQAGSRGVARADNGDRRQVERRRPPAHRQERRGVVDHLQAARIVGLAQRDQRHPEGVGGLELAFGIPTRVDPGGADRAAAAGEIGQRRERGARPAAVVDERPKCARADVVATDQPQPVEPLLHIGDESDYRCLSVSYRRYGPEFMLHLLQDFSMRFQGFLTAAGGSMQHECDMRAG